MSGPKPCICGAGVGERHVPLCEAATDLAGFAQQVAEDFAAGPNFDVAQESSPNPVWLRQLASTLKLEADLLAGHSHAMPTNQPTCAAVAIIASVHMGQASVALFELAALIDAAHSSLADPGIFSLSPVSPASEGPGGMLGRGVVDGSPTVGHPDLPKGGG